MCISMFMLIYIFNIIFIFIFELHLRYSSPIFISYLEPRSSSSTFILNFHIHFHRRSWCASWSFLTLFICDIHLHLNPPHSSSIIIFIKYFFIIFKVDRHLRLLSSIFIVIRISHCHIQCSSSALIFLSDLHVRLSSWIFSFILTFIWDLHLQFHLHLRYQSSISILDLRLHVYTHL